jgi:XTP/dITP diphosphohydrolase
MKKISKLLIGTNNKGKYKEIKDLLPKYIKTYSTSEFKLKSPKEDGTDILRKFNHKIQTFLKKNQVNLFS